MRRAIAILTSESLVRTGGVEQVVREIAKGLELRGYEVLVMHRENSGPSWIQQPKHFLARHFSDLFLSWHAGERLRRFERSELAAVISNGPIGWHLPKTDGIKAIHLYHGTYRQQA